MFQKGTSCRLSPWKPFKIKARYIFNKIWVPFNGWVGDMFSGLNFFLRVHIVHIHAKVEFWGTTPSKHQSITFRFEWTATCHPKKSGNFKVNIKNNRSFNTWSIDQLLQTLFLLSICVFKHQSEFFSGPLSFSGR